MALPDLEWSREFVAYARNISARGGDVDPARLAAAEKMIRDAGEDPAAIRATVRTPASRTSATTTTAPAAASDAGVQELLAGAEAALSNPAGMSETDRFVIGLAISTGTASPALVAKLQDLGIDVPGILKYCEKHGESVAAALGAELQARHQLAADQRIIAATGAGAAAQSAPQSAQKPVDELLEKDRANARLFGLSL